MIILLQNEFVSLFFDYLHEYTCEKPKVINLAIKS